MRLTRDTSRYLRLAAVLLVILSLSGVLNLPRVRGQALQWVAQFGGTGNTDASGVIATPSGIFVVGYTYGSLPGFTNPSEGYPDCFIVKLDLSGGVVWVREFGTPYSDKALGVAADASGVYVAGFASGILPGQDSYGAFVRKYDFNGNEGWTQEFGITERTVQATAVSVDGSGVYVAGFAQGALPGQTWSGDDDAFLRKYDSNGTEIWTKQFGSAFLDDAEGVSVGSSGVYVVGVTGGELPGQTSSGLNDVFVRQYHFNGTEGWTHQFGTNSYDVAFGVSATTGDVYVVGQVSGALPGQVSSGSSDVFVRKFGENGDEVWTRQFGAGFAQGNGVFTDTTGVFVTGYVSGTLPGQSSTGPEDGFARKYDSGGNEVWTRQFGTNYTGTDQGAVTLATAVSGDSTGVYIGGATNGAFTGQNSTGFFDAFVSKLSLGEKPAQSISATAFFTAGDQNPLPVNSLGEPEVIAVIAHGQVASTIPGQVFYWSNVTNTGRVPLNSLQVNETLPSDWVVNPGTGTGAVQEFLVLASGTVLITAQRVSVTLTQTNPQVVSVSIPDINGTFGSYWNPGDSILVRVKITYNLKGTFQSATSFPREYTASVAGLAFVQSAFTGDRASASGVSHFTVQAKVRVMRTIT